ncbi:unnamed protein product [Ectocarpus sp. 8 AP-2014]
MSQNLDENVCSSEWSAWEGGVFLLWMCIHSHTISVFHLITRHDAVPFRRSLHLQQDQCLCQEHEYEVARNMQVRMSPPGTLTVCARPGVSVERFAREYTPGISLATCMSMI